MQKLRKHQTKIEPITAAPLGQVERFVGRFLSPQSPFVGPARVCDSFKKMMIHIEVIPCEITDIVRKPLKHIAKGCCSVNYSSGFKTLNDAIVDSQSIGLRLLPYVKPENLFFVFGQTIESLRHAIIEFPFSPPPLGPLCNFNYDCNNKDCRGKDKYKTEPMAIILCKIIDAKILENTLCAEKHKCSGNSKRYEITWGELQELKKRFCD